MPIDEKAAPETGAQDQAAQMPEGFEAYRQLRMKGEDVSAAAADAGAGEPDGEPKAKSEPESDPDEGQEQEGVEDGEETEGEEEKPKAKKGGFQRRIDKLTREKHELEMRLAAVEGRSAGNAGSQQQTRPAAEGVPAKPQLENFDSYEEFTEALTAWQAEQAIARREAMQRQKVVEDKWTARLTEARGRLKDFDDVVDAELPVNTAMQQVILESEQGADLAYWLGKHPEECQRIAGLAPIAAARELGKVEAELAKAAGKSQEKAPEEKKPKASAAPKPVSPVGGGKGTQRIEDVTDFSTYRDLRMAEMKRG